MRSISTTIFFAILLALFAPGVGPARAQTLDATLSTFSERVAADIQKSKLQKVTVLDFTDLRGNQTEVGHYLAEQLSVSLVERRNGFSVLDRAILKTVLAQLKITDGMVDPATAKELGHVSGIDAIVYGNVTVFDSDIELTTKTISTDTAELIGAAKVRIPKSKDIDHLLGTTALPSQSARLFKHSVIAKDPIFQTVGKLVVKVDALEQLSDAVVVQLILLNTSTSEVIAVALHTKGLLLNLPSTLTSTDGVEYSCDPNQHGVRGLQVLCESMPDSYKALTDLQPDSDLKVSLRFMRPGGVTSIPTGFRLQLEMVVDPNYSETTYTSIRKSNQFEGFSLPGNCKLRNVVLEFPAK
jgi:curli biogenesis system outer membrane secretion channel CsgG